MTTSTGYVCRKLKRLIKKDMVTLLGRIFRQEDIAWGDYSFEEKMDFAGRIIDEAIDQINEASDFERMKQ